MTALSTQAPGQAGRTALLIAGAGLVVLVLSTALPPRPHFVALINNAGHAPIFGAIAWIALKLLPPLGRRSRRSGRRRPGTGARYLAAFGIALAIGAVVEVIQSFIGRDASLEDLLMDGAGAAGVLCLTAMMDPALRGRTAAAWYPAAWTLGLVISVAIVVAPLAHGALAYLHRRHAFPVVASFEDRKDLYFVAPSAATVERIALPGGFGAQPSGEPGLRVMFTGEPWPGIHLWEPEPDWRGYRRLSIDVVNPHAAPLALLIRIHDEDHDQSFEDRFNLDVEIEGMSREVVEIPLRDIVSGPQQRPIDLSRMAMVGIFESSESPIAGRAFYLARVWLE